MTQPTLSESNAGEPRVRTAATRVLHAPSLSVIVLSTGERGILDVALRSIAPHSRALEAQVIVVRASASAELEILAATHPCVEFLEAPPEASVSDMRSLGMSIARGDMISLRTDDAVGDAAWLSAFDSTVGRAAEGLRVVASPGIAAGVRVASGEVPRDLTVVDDDGVVRQERRKARAHGYSPATDASAPLAPRREALDQTPVLHAPPSHVLLTESGSATQLER